MHFLYNEFRYNERHFLRPKPFVKSRVDCNRVYIGDLSIASKSETDHLEHNEIFINVLKEHNLILNPDKWFATKIKLLGHTNLHRPKSDAHGQLNVMKHSNY